MTAKSLPPATVELIDPESGTSSGGGSSDIRIAVGDVVLFRFMYFTSPDNALRGIAGYLTEFVPPKTEVVGARIIDENGVTILPNYPGLTYDGTGGGPTSFNVDCGPSNCTLAGGSLAQLYGDTGVFWTGSRDLDKVPSDRFITLYDGLLMNPEPDDANTILALLKVPNPNSAPSYAHAWWDLFQMSAFGAFSGAISLLNTPVGYGSPVAGPSTFYPYDVNADKEFTGHVGPWQRIIHPGSTIGYNVLGSSAPNPGQLDRALRDFDFAAYPDQTVFYANPAFPRAATAVRFAVGELRAAEPGYVEIALRVTALPLAPLLTQPLATLTAVRSLAATWPRPVAVPAPEAPGTRGLRLSPPRPACTSISSLTLMWTSTLSEQGKRSRTA